jgi:hypothetical protein
MNSDSNVEGISQSNDELSRSAGVQRDSKSGEENEDSSTEQRIPNEGASSDGTKTEDHGDQQELESSIKANQENRDD